MVVVAFVHPDLGIGGAERLVVDAAIALQGRGHEVRLFTAHHDPEHCFAETADGTLKVSTVCDWLPRHTFGRCYAFWAYLRMVFVAAYLVFLSDFSPDVVFCDQISACIPILRFSRKAKILFYCHFPDMLLTQRKTLLKKIYRFPFDWLEEFTTGLADVILVNSDFTALTFHKTFTSLFSCRPKILYPSLNFQQFEPVDNPYHLLKDVIPPGKEFVFLSINRFERKKGLGLCIEALKELKGMCKPEVFKKCHLIIAGGYDERVEENVEHYKELVRSSADVKQNISFMGSFSQQQKLALLQTATCLLYTPQNEHFGIVPIEAMYMKVPVIACNNGGPLETVKHKGTGFLCEAKADQWAESMLAFVEGDSITRTMGEQGRERVQQHFSFDAFSLNLHQTVEGLCSVESEDNHAKRQFLFRVTLCFLVYLFYRFVSS